MTRRLLLAALLVFVALGPAGAGPAIAEDPPRRPLGPPPAPLPFTEEAAFLGFSGVGVASGPTRAGELAGLGVTWVQTDPVRWDAVQPQAPIAGRTLSDWTALDATVAGWQRAGFTPLLTLSPASAWASQPVEQTDWARFVREKLAAPDATLALRAARGAAPPRPEHWKAWQAFVRSVVERYDADGVDDAPGLVGRVREVQILDRVQDGDHWLGSADEYLRLLHHAAEGAGEASPACEVVHAAVDLRGLFRVEDGAVDAWKARLDSAVAAIPALPRLEVERGLHLVLRSLEMPSLYRALPHVGSGNHREDAVNLRALRARLDARAATNVSMWLTESPARRLDGPRVPLPGASRSPAIESAVRACVREAQTTRPAELVLWLEGATAADFVRGAALARAVHATRIFVDDEEGGLLASAYVGRGATSATWSAARQMNALLLGHRSASEAPLGASGTAVVFTFGERAPLPWVAVLLHDDGGPWGGEPGKARPVTRAQVPLPPGDVDVEELALADGPPRRRRMKVVEGLLTLDLTSAPLYVFPAR